MTGLGSRADRIGMGEPERECGLEAELAGQQLIERQPVREAVRCGDIVLPKP